MTDTALAIIAVVLMLPAAAMLVFGGSTSVIPFVLIAIGISLVAVRRRDDDQHGMTHGH